MLSALTTLKNLIKTKCYHIDHPLFRLHYQATVGLLLAFCLILTAKVMFGDTIDCRSRTLGREDFYDNMCYSQGTFTEYAIDEKSLNKAVAEQQGTATATVVTPAPSLDPDSSESPEVIAKHSNETTRILNTDIFPYNVLSETEAGAYLMKQFRYIHRMVKNKNFELSDRIRYMYSGIQVPRDEPERYDIKFWHRYYQYIPIILFLQAVFFYIPHYLWKNWENGIVSTICKQLHENRFAPNEYIESNYHMIEYLQNCFTFSNLLVYKYYLCHVIMFINLIVQITVLNAIFNNQFVTYGIDAFYYSFIDSDIYGLRDMHGKSTTELNSPMDFVFPKITKCSMEVLSEAGNRLDQYSFMCVLPLNIVHDKFFLVLWFWFLILTVLTVAQLIFDTLCITIPMLRKRLFKRRFGPYLSDCSQHSSNLSEWFLLYLIGSNSDQFAFTALLKKLEKEDWRASSPSENQSLV